MRRKNFRGIALLEAPDCEVGSDEDRSANSACNFTAPYWLGRG